MEYLYLALSMYVLGYPWITIQYINKVEYLYLALSMYVLGYPMDYYTIYQYGGISILSYMITLYPCTYHSNHVLIYNVPIRWQLYT